MKKKNNKGERKRFQPHFRKAYNGKFTGHPQYVYDEEGRKYKILGIVVQNYEIYRTFKFSI